MVKNFSKYQVATAIAVFFHAVGLAGILFFDATFFTRCTPINLVLSFMLLLWTQETKNVAFFTFMLLTFLIGYLTEVAGVNTGLIFGKYSYGDVLGPRFLQVPLLIAINWFIIIYCSGTVTRILLFSLTSGATSGTRLPPPVIKSMAVIVDGATLAVLFDWLMEPVAVKLGFWSWDGVGVPIFNYICWLAISLLLMMIFHLCNFEKHNKFAVNLLLIQALFFLVLRTFLN